MKYLLPIGALIAILSACSGKNENLHVTYTIVESQSAIEWKGAAPDHFHKGAFSVYGKFDADNNGDIKNGKFFIPVASITNFDLPDSVKPQLLDHLKGPDFFNLLLYPEASFEIEQITAFDNHSGANTHSIRGALTMLGKTNSIQFPAKITVENGSINTQAVFSIDRLKWGMTSYSDPKGGLYILPEVDIALNIKATRW